ncbi:sigma factor-like helix-turn-helix DNA-binding protein [Streptomyces sp. 1331.2]|uniref:sigma factor-like helix-turn-helix DNA-binding protein n=1 Tax=Streptomyces sp. 1331.2 TaxID=1938835 RepID=UPI000BCFA9AD|nr:sigma factor-like helix-turn-helix DNA-binding protein [Streptomyces sp. 1331.2]SOB83683.1 DNA-binding transcriptional regulator, CsgD family [Streptomyces sp. 1331.2]
MATPPAADSPARPDRDAAQLLQKLTPREAQTLAHLAAGHDLPRTAAVLGITPATARSYLSRAMRKLGVPTEAEAVTLAAGTLPYPPTATVVNFVGLTPASLGPAAVGGRPATAPGGGSVRADGEQPARPPRRERGDTAHTPPPGHAAARPERTDTGRAQDSAAAGSDEQDDAPQPAPATGRQRRRSAADRTTPPEGAVPPGGGRPQAGHAGGVERGDVAAEQRAATMAEGSQHSSGGGRAQSTPAGAEARGDTAPAAPDSTTDSGRQQPAGTEGYGTMAQLAPPAPAARERQESVPPAPAGRPAGSFEELYESAYTRLVQQVFLLTACRHRAVHCVRRAFGEARRGWRAVARSGDPEGWVRVRACELALSPWHRGGPRRAHAWALPHRRIRVRPADEAQAVLPDHDRLTDRDRALLKALRRLSRPQRRALVLHDGLGLPAAAIAVEVESTRAAAEGRVWTARAALARSVPDLVGPDPAAPGFADELSRLLHRAAVRGCPQPHRSPVPVLRARHRLWTASRTGAAALLTAAVGGATLATLAGVRPAVVFGPPAPPAPSLCLRAAEGEEPAVPLAPGGAPNGITSLWCSPAPGLEAVLVEPHAQAVARWELPPAARGAGAPPPQGPTVCRLWSPLPCTTGPRH